MAEDPNQSRELVKKAFFGEILQAQITENISKARSHQEKSNFKQLLSGPKVEKYKLWRQGFNSLLYNKIRRKAIKRSEKTKKDLIVEMVHRFYEDDSISRAAAGKKECITRNKIKKQKRYLLDSLENIHQKFLQTRTLTIGYSLFCRLRPFWAVPPKLTDRDTCACIIHENMNLKLSALKKSKILHFDNYQTGLQILCCNRYSEKCLLRQCNGCSTKVTFLKVCNKYIHTYIKSRLFPGGVGRDYLFPLATISAYFLRFIHIHNSLHTNSAVSGTFDLTLYQDVLNLIKIRSSRSSHSDLSLHTLLVYLLSQPAFIHPLHMTEPSQHTLFYSCNYIFFHITTFPYHAVPYPVTQFHTHHTP
ncbi:uncharacterized protein LOC132902462 [Amyelois transitella]|uniref:uncharacterized protein LOC132902462 n=1 Tax=Amyelois transitella TaxID=680683 RepID=UPI00298FB122|nr:uncharacterized protein LOC132902462 [Amyelois transitella]